MDLNDDLPELPPAWPPQLADWVRGMHFLFAKNDGHSLTHPHPNSFFSNRTVSATDFQGFHVADSIYTSVAALDPFHSDHRLFTSEWARFLETMTLKSLDP